MAGCASVVPTRPVCPPPETSTMLDAGSVTFTVALSERLVGVCAVTVVVPRLPVVVNTPVLELIVATVGSDELHVMGVGTVLPAASVAVAVNVREPAPSIVTVLGATTTRTAVDPGPTN